MAATYTDKGTYTMSVYTSSLQLFLCLNIKFLKKKINLNPSHLHRCKGTHTQTHVSNRYIIIGPVIFQAACSTHFSLMILRDKQCSPPLPPPRSVLLGKGKPGGEAGG